MTEEIKPTLIKKSYDKHNRKMTLETRNPTRKVSFNPLNPDEWTKNLAKLGVTTDDYEEFMQWMSKNSLLQPANSSFIANSELTVPDIFAFKDEKGNAEDLFAFSNKEAEVDEEPLSNLYKFAKKQKKS